MRGVERAESARNRVRAAVWTLTWVFGMVIIVGVWGAGAVAAGRGLVGIGQIVALAQLMTQVYYACRDIRPLSALSERSVDCE